jgi:peptidoglycan/xylan/chitin deacetylase (PgdA/CDA1 family)
VPGWALAYTLLEMSSPIKIAIYHLSRAAGLFALARWVTRERLRILAYHGFAFGDEAKFRSKTFINPDTFARRLQLLKSGGWRVVGLDDAVTALRSGKPPDHGVVITIDDGYCSTLRVAAPLLRKHGFPATVYLTSYHMQHQTPVFDLVVGYMIWKSDRQQITWSADDVAGAAPVALLSPAQKDRFGDQILALGKSFDSEAARVQLCRRLATALGVDYDAIVNAESFRLMTAQEAIQIQGLGVTVGLHTHRHKFPPNDLSTCRKEIEDNRAFLRQHVGSYIDHFCYPSGVYDSGQWALLDSMGVKSATTCEAGLTVDGKRLQGLHRALDGESVSEIEFLAEMSGFAHLLRTAFRRPQPRATPAVQV